MTPPSHTSAHHRLAVVPGGGALVPQRVLLADGAVAGSHLLSWRADGVWTSTAVEVVPSPEVPAEVLAISEELAADLEIVPDDLAEWKLHRKPAVPARSITLELATERGPREAAQEVARSPLVGRLVWVPPDGREMWLPVGDVLHRLRAVEVDGDSGVIAQLTDRTRVELYAPAARAGVDVVVLADGSQSMAVDDLEHTAGPPGARGRTGWLRRIEGLKEALNDLLDMRLKVSGRISQIALLEFGDSVEQRFPARGGMAQLDGDSPAALVDEFRHAVRQLRPSSPTTDIGNALHAAANLLYRCGRPANDKLIVLVSDGANWQPAGTDGTGEMVDAVKEPVSLMAHLHSDRGIKLHAIGISTEQLFHKRGTLPPRPALVPNHDLLEELVKVGGGDPTAIGGLDELERYFSGLGAGIVHRVRETPAKLVPARGSLADATLAALRLLAGPKVGWDDERITLHGELSSLVGDCGREAERVLGCTPWGPDHWERAITRDCGRTATTDVQLRKFLIGVANAFVPVPEVSGRARALDPWAVLMKQLKDAAKGSVPDYRMLSRTCGCLLESAAQAQVSVMRRVCRGLTDLRDELVAGPVATPAPPPQEASGDDDFRYGD